MSADMAIGSSAALQVPQFSGENYQIWVVKMRSYLKSFGLWEYVAKDKQVLALRANPTIAQIKQYEEEKMKRDKVVTCLHSALKDFIFTSIMHLETSKEIWDELNERYEGSERVRNVKMLTLKREFEMLKMKESESVKDYSSKLSELVNQMRLYDMERANFLLVQPAREQITCQRIVGTKASNKSSAIFAKKWGHIEKLCRSKPQHAQQANFTDEQPDAEDHMFMASQVCCSASKDVWYVDSGCTSHMVKDSSLFTSLDNNDRTNVKLENGEMVQATGKGTISVQTSKGPKLIHDVLLIPDLDQNLLSVAQLLKKGYSCSFKDNYCTIFDSCGVEVVKVGMHDNSFLLNLEQVNHSAFMSKLDDSALWHKRYGHFNMDALKYLQDHDMVRDMQAISHTSDDLCDACQLGKMHRKPFSSENVTRAKNKLELVHSDLCGPMSVPSHNQNKAVQGKTPVEAWSEIKPYVKHLKVFGSICYSHVADAKRSKLDDKAEMGIFLGYAANSKDYRVFNLQAKKLIISRDIQVDEDAYWDWENEHIRNVKSSQLTTIPAAIDSQDEVVNDIEDEEVESGSPMLKTKRSPNEPTLYVKACGNGTIDYGIWYGSGNGKLEGFVDSDWAGSVDDSKSTTGYVFSLKSAISMAKNPVQHGRTKHINVKFHAIREAEKNGEIQLLHCKSEEQHADILIKALAGSQFNVLRSKLGVFKKSFNEEC
ncbi:hypothetical protein EZV62_017243 [Acer yangbiense]|uniref:Uncharacterized protein n=1 Tax=Acer yangbiense TaxID=1000413 RepID=A0A5C7HFV9_9ROSI|nr:hypothetical protein EZV62_017243 [Acer yangbiense]